MMDISLALGGGGVRGVAHLGVLRALEKHGFKVKAIAGTSVGGLAGAVYAAGFSTEEIEATVSQLDKGLSFSPNRSGEPALLSMSWITDKVDKMLGDRTFDDLKIPFAATAVNLSTGKEFILQRGKVMDAVKATIAIPGVFPGQNFEGQVLSDGGVMDPVPIQVARWMRPDLPVVAVPLHALPEGMEADALKSPIAIPGPTPIIERIEKLRTVQAFNIFTRSMEVSGQHLTELAIKLYNPEVVIYPRVGHISILQEINAPELIQAGIDATTEMISALEAERNWMNKLRRQMRHRILPNPHPEHWEIVR